MNEIDELEERLLEVLIALLVRHRTEGPAVVQSALAAALEVTAETEPGEWTVH